MLVVNNSVYCTFAVKTMVAIQRASDGYTLNEADDFGQKYVLLFRDFSAERKKSTCHTEITAISSKLIILCIMQY